MIICSSYFEIFFDPFLPLIGPNIAGTKIFLNLKLSTYMKTHDAFFPLEMEPNRENKVGRPFKKEV